MFLEIYKDTKELGDAEARRIAALLRKKPDALLCLAAGQSAICVYERLIEMYRAGEVDFSKTRIVGLDEWCDYPAYEGSARWILDTTFFNGINLDRSRMRMFNSNPADPEKECREIEKYIDDNGEIDYMILGVGMNGHVALNEPGVDLTLGAHVATLADKTREVSSKYFENGTPVTLTRGLTLGYKNIFEAKDLVVILNGAHKAPIVKKFMETPISNEFPVTNIKRSPIARVVMDQAAASDIYRV